MAIRKNNISEPTRSGKRIEEPTEAPIGTLTARTLVEELLRKFSESLKQDKSAKLSVADCIRLLQLQKDLAEESPREMEVRWVDSENSEDTGGE